LQHQAARHSEHVISFPPNLIAVAGNTLVENTIRQLHVHTLGLLHCNQLCGSELFLSILFFEKIFKNFAHRRERQFISMAAFCIRLSASDSPLVSGWGRGSNLRDGHRINAEAYIHRSSISLRSPRLLISDCLQYTCPLTRSLACSGVCSSCSEKPVLHQSDAAL
jgi:hypothetical protein